MGDGVAGVLGIIVLPVVMLAARVLVVFFESTDLEMEKKKFNKVIAIYGALFAAPLIFGVFFRPSGHMSLELLPGIQMFLLLAWMLMHTFYMPRAYVQRARALGKGKGLAYLGTIPLPLFVPVPLFDVIALAMLSMAKTSKQAESA